MTNETDGWELLGQVAVDSASLVVVDPAYAEFLSEHDLLLPVMEARQLDSGFPLGVLLPTLCGDGVYPVYLDRANSRIIIDLDPAD